jgi:hypothetical protein
MARIGNIAGNIHGKYGTGAEPASGGGFQHSSRANDCPNPTGGPPVAKYPLVIPRFLVIISPFF